MTDKRFGPIRQLGYVVECLDEAVAAWQQSLGLGPWTIIRNVQLQCDQRGEKQQPLINLALAYQGEVQIELIQQLDDGPSPYREYIDRGHFGLHHMAYLCENIDGDILRAKSQGLDLVCDINMPDGGRYAYFQRPGLGNELYVEFLEATPTMKAMFKDGGVASEKPQLYEQIVDLDFAEMQG